MTYQTTILVEDITPGQKALMKYRTTFEGPSTDHDLILSLTRDLHAKKDGKASALIEIFENADKWELLERVGGKPKADSLIQWHIDMSNLRLKLLAVRNELMRVTPVSSSLGLTYSIGAFAFPKLVKTLWEAIGEEDPRTVKCKQCIDICRAWITPEGECPSQENKG